MQRRNFILRAVPFMLPLTFPHLLQEGKVFTEHAARVPLPVPSESEEQRIRRCTAEFAENPRRATKRLLCEIDPRVLVGSDSAGVYAEYTVTASDVLTLLRAVEGEVAPSTAAGLQALDAQRVAETLVNRFMYLRARGASYNLATFVRHYAQPLNAKWADPESEACAANPERCTEGQIARRRDYRTRTEFTEQTVTAVRSALREGHVATRTSAIHFAMPGVRMSPEMIQLTPHARHMNTLFATPDSVEHWKGYETT